SVLVWQGGTPEDPTFVWYSFVLQDGLEVSTAAWEALFGIPMVTADPSVSGDGSTVAFVETSGALAAAAGVAAPHAIGSLTFEFSGSQLSLLLSAYWVGDALADPSLSYGADKLLFQEDIGGVAYLTLLDNAAETVTDVLAGMPVDHPFLTADGAYATFSFGQVAF